MYGHQNIRKIKNVWILHIREELSRCGHEIFPKLRIGIGSEYTADCGYV